jgi:VCBS repeat-containing protein
LTRRPALFGGLLALVGLLLGVAGIGALLANPIVTVQLQAPGITEGNAGTSTATFTVSLSQALGAGQQIVLAVQTLPGPSNQATAGASCGGGVDYLSNSATLTFNPGDISQTFPVTICGDTTDELNESFVVRVTVQSQTGVPTVQPPAGQFVEFTAIIFDDDNPTVQSISDPTAVEGNTLDFVVTLSAAPIENVVIAYSTGAGGDTADSTATCPALPGNIAQDYIGVTSGTLTIPAGQQTGTISITVCDDALAEGAETMTLTLDPSNSFSVNTPFGDTTATGTIQDANVAPTIPPGQTFSVNENSAVGTVVLPAPGQITVTDPDGPGTAFTVTGGTGQGLFNVNATTGQITTNQVFDFETPPTSYTLQVQVCDTGTPNRCGTGTVTVNVLDQNEAAPAITPGQVFSVAENSPGGAAVGTVAVTDADGPAGTRAFTITAPAGAPFAIASPGGQVTVSGALDFEAQSSYTLTIQVCDGGTPNLCGTGTVTVNVTDVNEAPTVDLNGVAPGINYTAAYTEQAAPTTIVDPAAAVTDPDTTAPNNQIATLTATITGCEASESLSASSGTWDAATCTFTVTGPLSAAAMSTVLQSLSYANTSDVPPASRTITVIATDNGTPQQTSSVATITLAITAVDDPPTLVNNGLTVGEGQSAAISAAALQAVDPDTPPANLSFTLTALPTRGELRLNGVLLTGGSFTQANINAGELVYIHDGSETTSDSFSVTLSDGTTTLPVATFNITITPENDNPVVTTSAGATPYLQGQPPVVIDPGVTVTDADSPNFNGGSLSVALTGGGSQDQLAVLNQGDGPGQIGLSGGIVRYGGVPIGSLSVSSGGPLVVLFNASATPNAVEALARAITFAIPTGTAPSGPRTATFIVSDGAGGNSAPATKVIDANLLPIAVNDSQQVLMNTPRRLPVLANDSDPDGDPLTITAVGTPANGSAQIIENGQALRYTPNAGYQGPDSFTYTISDGRGGTATATVTLTVDRPRILLPYIHDRPVEPDLVVDFRLVPARPGAFMPARVEVTVTNRGRGPASNFWVDFYINPRQAPEVNQPWNELCRDRNCRGIAWFYAGTLRPGESVTFTSAPQSADNPNGYQSRYTLWDGFFENGSYSLYAYVDSWNRDSSGAARDPRGAIAEENEDNNRAERQVTVEIDR